MATTRLMPLHIGKGGSIASALGRSVDYVENPEKTNNSELITSYECDPVTANAEFLLSKRQYENITGRSQGDKNIIAYHLRQSFKPGEITPELANKIGYDLAMSFTKGKHAFIVATHVDKSHVHSHIIINSTSLDCTRKFRNFIGSSKAIRRISDSLCLENGLSVIENPKPSRGSYGTWLNEKNNKPQKEPVKLNLLIDIENNIKAMSSPSYEQALTIINIKEAAQTLIFLQDNNLTQYSVLEQKTSEAVHKFNDISDQIKAKDRRMNEINQLQKHISTYIKTKDVYAEYRRQNVSKKFYEKNESALILRKTAKKYFDKLGLEKLPTINMLQTEYAKLSSEKSKLYAEYKKAKTDMIQLSTAKQNTDRLLNRSSQKKQRSHSIER